MGPHHAARFSPLMASSRRAGTMVGATGDEPFDFPEIPTWYRVLTAAGTIGGAFHGYKRDNSIGWAIAWGLLGGMFPFIVLPIAAAQGFGEPKRG